MPVPALSKIAGDAGATAVTPTGGSPTTVPAILVPLDPTAPNFATSLIAILNAVAPSLPTTLPSAAGKVWNNGGVISVS